MEKHHTCVGCSKDFKVLSRVDSPAYRQHEVEMNVECPLCFKANAIVWPQDESLPLVVPVWPENPQVKSDSGDYFYVQAQCCTSCGVPQAVAPELVGWTNGNLSQCYWMKQPQTADELDRAIKVIQAQELGCHRYSGTNPAILERLPPEDCDHIRPGLRLKSPPFFASSGTPPKFQLSASEESGLLNKLWRKLRHHGSTPD